MHIARFCRPCREGCGCPRLEARERDKRSPSWCWTVSVSDWPIGRADYDLTAEEALAVLTTATATKRKD